MSPSSSTSDGLLGRLSGAPEVDEALTDRALVVAMLDVEVALASSSAAAGAVPEDAATAIAATCDVDRIDIAALAEAALAGGNPVIPLVGQVRALLPDHAEPWLHHGATSQDVLDTALVLVSRRAGATLLDALRAATAAAAALADAHRSSPMLGRTLGQAASPTTFGLTAAGWLRGLTNAARRLDDVLTSLPVQLGGPVGTLAALGEHGVDVAAGLARTLHLREPVLPWHTERSPVLETAAALAEVLVACGKVGLDVGLLARTEVDEVREGGAGRGGSSSMPHKQNPVDAVLLVAAARRAPGVLATLFGAGLHEHQRAAGSWHAEWEPLLELLHLAGGAAVRTAGLLDGLQVRPETMRANLDATGGTVLAEAVAARLSPYVGRGRAQALVGDAVRRGGPFRDALLAVPEVAEHLGPDGVDAALDPAGWLGSADLLVDRALDDHRKGAT